MVSSIDKMHAALDEVREIAADWHTERPASKHLVAVDAANAEAAAVIAESAKRISDTLEETLKLAVASLKEATAMLERINGNLVQIAVRR